MDDYKCSHTLAALLNPPSRDTPAWGHTAAWGHRLSAVVGFGFFRCAMSTFVFRHRGLVANSESTLLGRVDGEPRRAGGEGQIAACPIERHADHAAALPAGSLASPATLPRRVENG